MSASDSPNPGIFASLTRLLHSTVSLLETRLELLTVELKEEKIRIIQILIWASAAIFLAAISLVMITLTILFAFWDDPTARIAGLIIISVFYLGCTAFAAKRLNDMLRHGGLPFAETLDQLKKDRSCLPK